MTENDLGFRLLSLFRYWNIIEYLFPYKYLIDSNWDDVLRDFIPKFMQAQTFLTYRICLLELITTIGDSHAFLAGINPETQKKENGKMLNDYRGTNVAPVCLDYIEDKMVVFEYLNPDFAMRSGLKKGDIVTHIDNQKVEDLLQEHLLFTPGSNLATQASRLSRNLLRTNNKFLMLQIVSNGVSKTIKLECFTTKKMPILPKRMDPKDYFKMLTPQIAYIYPGLLKGNYLP